MNRLLRKAHGPGGLEVVGLTMPISGSQLISRGEVAAQLQRCAADDLVVHPRRERGSQMLAQPIEGQLDAEAFVREEAELDSARV